MASAIHLSQQETLDEWLALVREVTEQVAGWAAQEGWTVSSSQDEEINEAPYGSYRVSALQIETDLGTVQFRPVGRRVLGALGRFDLVAWPSLFRVMLLRLKADGGTSSASEKWVIRTESGIDWPEPWGPQTFGQLARALART